MSNRNVTATLRNTSNAMTALAGGNIFTVNVETVSEWVPQVGDAVTIEDNGQVRPPTIDAGPNSTPFTIVQTINDNQVQITPADPPLNLDLNAPISYAVFEGVPLSDFAGAGPPTEEPKLPAKDEVDLTNEELDLIAYALDNIDESIVAATFGLTPKEADEFLNTVYKKIKD